jgi:glycosyltransferase involved in cell wall biosynthesis
VSAVDVVIPVHNMARLLPAAIDSVLRQGDAVAQILVVDDASTDDSAAVAERFGAPVRLLRRTSSGGVGAARNTGIAAATAPLIGFLDADDLWPDGSLALRHAALAADPGLDVAFGLVRQFVCDSLPPERRARIHCPPEAQPGYLMGAMLARREVFDRFGRLDAGLRTGEFIAWLAAARQDGLAETMVKQVVLRRRLHGENTGVLRPELRHEYLRVVRQHLARRGRES